MPPLVVLVYVVTVIAVAGYAASLWLRQSRLRRQLDHDRRHDRNH